MTNNTQIAKTVTAGTDNMITADYVVRPHDKHLLVDASAGEIDIDMFDAVEGDEREPEGEIWKILMFLVLAILVVELYLARRVGDYARRTRTREVAS